MPKSPFDLFRSLALWFDSSAMELGAMTRTDVVDWFRVMPFVGMHLACLGVIWVGWSWTAVAVVWGFFWWEIDLTYYGLLILERMGLIRDLRQPPPRVYERA